MRAAAAVDHLALSDAGSIITDNGRRIAFGAVLFQDFPDQAGRTHFETEVIIKEPINQCGHIGALIFHFIIPLIL